MTNLHKTTSVRGEREKERERERGEREREREREREFTGSDFQYYDYCQEYG